MALAVHDLDFYPLTINCLTRDTEITIIDHTGQQQLISVSFFDSLFVTKGKSAINLEIFNFKIKSENGEFTKIRNVMRRPIGEKELVYRIATNDCAQSLAVTANHIVPVLRGDSSSNPIFIKARNIVIGDRLTVFDGDDFSSYTLRKVVDIEVINDYQGYVYDIETENHLFVANNYLVHNCIQIDIAKLFEGGFSTGHGKLREPSNIRSAASLAAIAIQSDQNDCFGGQSIAKFDYDLSKYVAYTYVDEFVRTLDYDNVLEDAEAKKFKKQCRSYVDEHGHIINDDGIAFMDKALSSTKALPKFLEKDALKERHRLAYKYTNKDSYQAMEAFVHNMNTLHCIPGSEKIWVFDTKTEKLRLIKVETLYDKFKMRRFQAITLNEETGKAEFQYIEGIEKKDNHRRLIEVTTDSGQKFRVTDNHKVYSFSEKKMKLVKKYPEKLDNVISPCGIEMPVVSNVLDLTRYGKVANSPYTEDTVEITPDFCELLGYYVGDGSIISNSILNIGMCQKLDIPRLKKLVKNIFGVDFNYRVDYFDHSTLGRIPKSLNISLGRRICNAIADIAGKRANKKKIPNAIMLGTKEMKLRFLNAYIACDGRRDRYTEVTSVSRLLILQVGLLFASFGGCPYFSDPRIGKPAEKDGKEIRHNYPLWTLSLGGIASDNMGIKVYKPLPKFEIPKCYSGHFVKLLRGKYKLIWEKLPNNARRRGSMSYTQLEQVLRDNEIKDFYFNNFFVMPVSSISESNSGKEYVYDICVAKNHNFLTEHNVFVRNSRAGAQVPFSSVNYGTDVSEEGRIITKNLLYALEAGLGDGETPIFPIHVFKVKDGINGEKGDPNYDLLQLACKVSGERLFPNFVFLDAPFNLKYYKENRPETEAATMGCVLSSAQVIVRDLGYGNYSSSLENTSISRTVTMGQLFDLCEASVEHQGASDYKNVETLKYPSSRPVIYDSASGQFVKIKKIIKNPDQSNWVKITVAGRTEPIFVTATHYLQVSRNGGAVINRVSVKDLTLNDYLIDTDGRHLQIIQMTFVGYMGEFGYDVETESDRFDFDGIRSHNCRTRVVGNVYDPAREIFTGRGNLSFTTINLPRLAILSDHNVDVFFEKLKDMVDLVFEQLLDRFEVQASKKVKNLPFIMGQGVYLDSDKYGPEDTVREIIKHGTLTVGFIGLAECLVSLIGKHHGESAEAQELGLKIIGYLRERCDKESEETGMNFSLIGSPAEGVSGRFLQIDRKQFGIIPGVTDKDWYTNSNHVPVEFPIGISKKIDIEAPYHALENGGHISYVEVDGDIASNHEAFEQIIQYMKKAGIGYGSINHDGGDFDPVCGYHGKIGETCPRCGRKSGEAIEEQELAKKLAEFKYSVDDEIALSKD